MVNIGLDIGCPSYSKTDLKFILEMLKFHCYSIVFENKYTYTIS